MFFRFLWTLVWLLLWLVVVLLGPVTLLLFGGRLASDLMATLGFGWLAFACLSLLVVLQVLLQRVWFFPGSGVPVSEDELRLRLLAVNNLAVPVRVGERRRKLTVSWRYDEVPWCELFSRRNLSNLYELRLRLDPLTRTVTLMDRRRSVQFLFCPEDVKTGWPRVILPFLWLRQGRLGSVEQYAATEPYLYDFHPREIKAPVMGTILASGWDVRFSLF